MKGKKKQPWIKNSMFHPQNFYMDALRWFRKLSASPCVAFEKSKEIIK